MIPIDYKIPLACLMSIFALGIVAHCIALYHLGMLHAIFYYPQRLKDKNPSLAYSIRDNGSLIFRRFQNLRSNPGG